MPTMTAAIATITIRTGTKVLAAKPDKNGYRRAVTYSNRTQATKKAAALMADGLSVEVIQPFLSRVFYVRVLD